MADLGSSTNGSALDVAEILGPKNLPLVSVIPMTIFYSLIFVCGMVGNVSTCLVIANNQYMQTATNMYLFNLAVTDMLTLLAGHGWIPAPMHMGPYDRY
ncbi:Pyrokinin-1 receptor [Amphibalanus amphitrite]|uniref:Pyrokinin-1 receptor n=1 Tax=Amphibalanus amphitrite TaxID=1232801 RepID=A0A6A4X6T8_AMPAM|nr:Pyrokinin-1 receptor [Amphibalanus amphitrite]